VYDPVTDSDIDPSTGLPGTDPLTGPGVQNWDVCDGDRIYDVAVMDYTIGEMGSAGTETDPKDVPGLKQNTHVYTVAQNGTVLEIKEGKTFVGAQELATSFSIKKQFDVISREFQLNKNMLCDKTICSLGYSGFSEDLDVVNDTARCASSAGSDSCCAMIPDYIYRTCFDLTTKRLYIRSRIQDTRGRLWVTKTDQLW
jgi:hypothetical protein